MNHITKPGRLGCRDISKSENLSGGLTSRIHQTTMKTGFGEPISATIHLSAGDYGYYLEGWITFPHIAVDLRDPHPWLCHPGGPANM
jgi:hypothetical protein